jgi:microcompartment protein CcmL/EutN
MIKQGRCLVVVQGDAAEVAKAYGTLNTTEAVKVEMHAKMSDDSPEIDDRPLPR